MSTELQNTLALVEAASNLMRWQIPGEDVELMSDKKSLDGLNGLETGIECTEGRDDGTIETTKNDTLGLRLSDKPKRGGVYPNTEGSVGEISEITNPTALVPFSVQIDVPRPPDVALSTLIDVEVGSLPSSAENLTDAMRKEYARMNLQAGIQVRDHVTVPIYSTPLLP